MRNEYDCVVVGGGVAGSTVAYYLAKQGFHTAALERRRGPHHKVCGEFLSWEAIVLLKDMGIALDSGSPVIKYFRLFSPRLSTGFTLSVPGRGLSRYKLDEELLHRAREMGADVRRGINVSKCQKKNGSYILESNDETFSARRVFLATGKHDFSKAAKRRGTDDTYLALKFYLKPSETEFNETVALFTFPGGYGGLCPVEGNRLNFCFVIEKARYKSLGGKIESALSHLCRTNRKLNAVIHACDIDGPTCALGYIPYGFLDYEDEQDDYYRVGDQRVVIPSFTGDGMAIALTTAKHTAYTFGSQESSQVIDRKLIQATLRRQMRWAMKTHFVLKSSRLTDAGILISKCQPSILDTIFQKTRIRDKPYDIFSSTKISYPRR